MILGNKKRIHGLEQKSNPPIHQKQRGDEVYLKIAAAKITYDDRYQDDNYQFQGKDEMKKLMLD